MGDVEDLKNKVDKLKIDVPLLAQSIEHLAASIKSMDNKLEGTNDKIENILVLMSKQVKLEETQYNMDTSFKEFAKRMYKRMEALEETHDGEGCPAIKAVKKDTDGLIKGRNWIVYIILSSVVLALLGTVIVKG